MKNKSAPSICYSLIPRGSDFWALLLSLKLDLLKLNYESILLNIIHCQFYMFTVDSISYTDLKKKNPWFLMIQINLTMLKKRSNCKTQGRVKIEKFGMAVILYTHVHVNTFKLYMSFQWCRCFVNLFVSLEYKRHLPTPFSVN